MKKYDNYYNDLESREDIEKEFNIKLPENIKILIADYELYCYDGSAFVIFEDSDNKLYEVSAAHCSCYGLEDQWEPEETSFEAILCRKLDPALKDIITKYYSEFKK